MNRLKLRRHLYRLGAVVPLIAKIERPEAVDAIDSVLEVSDGITLAAQRPLAPTLGVCHRDSICRRMTLHWGIVPFLVEDTEATQWRNICELLAGKCGLARTGGNVLLVSGFNDDPLLNEPVLKLLSLHKSPR
jgi:pyruvate kinase